MAELSFTLAGRRSNQFPSNEVSLCSCSGGADQHIMNSTAFYSVLLFGGLVVASLLGCCFILFSWFGGVCFCTGFLFVF